MPSLVMYLAVAKKYIETHPEENEKESIEGILAPDRKRNLSTELAKLHYGEETSHRPDLNRYYHEEGLESSYNRGYFLNLLTDYLFYNRYLQEYSVDIFHDFKRMNRKIEEKYDVCVPEELESRMDYEDGELKTINEESVYKFIDAVGQLNLEEYKSQMRKEDDEHQIKLVGIKEGLLYKHNYANYMNSHDEVYFYGFENNYGALVQRIIGYGETEGAKDGLFRFQPVGIATKPSKMMEFDWGSINAVKERFSTEERKDILKRCENILNKSIKADVGFGFENMTLEDVKKLLQEIRKFEERTPKKEITDAYLNSDYVEMDYLEIE